MAVLCLCQLAPGSAGISHNSLIVLIRIMALFGGHSWCIGFLLSSFRGTQHVENDINWKLLPFISILMWNSIKFLLRLNYSQFSPRHCFRCIEKLTTWIKLGTQVLKFFLICWHPRTKSFTIPMTIVSPHLIPSSVPWHKVALFQTILNPSRMDKPALKSFPACHQAGHRWVEYLDFPAKMNN